MRVLIPVGEKNPNKMSTPARFLESSDAMMVFNTDDNSFEVIYSKYLGQDLKNYGVTDLITGKICKSCYHSIKKQGIEIWSDNSSINVFEAYQAFLLGGLFLMKSSNQSTCPIHNIKVTRDVKEKSKMRIIQ
ncbi:MAG: hypothetical protein GPJ54_07060 [Candidatus Heimdallarchaeota archaeon]|nr:hypothetical protein [Candidatus Heimdallarchaeota archaeon]